jgi:hypothetical protein
LTASNWARFIKKVFAADPLVCADCRKAGCLSVHPALGGASVGHDRDEQVTSARGNVTIP